MREWKIIADAQRGRRFTGEGRFEQEGMGRADIPKGDIMHRSRFSTSQHLVALTARDTVFSPDWALSCITSIYDHILWGPDTMLTRSMSLNTVMSARFAVLAGMPRAVRDAHKDGN